MNIMRTKIEMKTYQRRGGYPSGYYASEKEVSNPNYRTAKPAVKLNEFGHYRNGKITSVRFYES
jgi:hypothetical protein